MRRMWLLGLLGVLAVGTPQVVHAVPFLQLPLDGGAIDGVLGMGPQRTMGDSRSWLRAVGNLAEDSQWGILCDSPWSIYRPADMGLGVLFGTSAFAAPEPCLGLASSELPTDSLLAPCPAVGAWDAEQIILCDVSPLAVHAASLHADLYRTVLSERRSELAPLLREPDAEAMLTPEPSPVVIWILIGLTWAGSAWVYQYWRRWQTWQREEAFAMAQR